MDYLLTWYEGEEVNYRFLNERELRHVKIEVDKPYSLMEIKSGKTIANVRGFMKHDI